MFHAGGAMGTLTIPVSGGTTVVQRRFEAGAVISAIERHRATVIGLVPTMVGLIVHHRDFSPERLASIRRIAYGASPMPIGLIQELQRQLPEADLVQTYGITEASGVLTYLTPADHRSGGAAVRSAGRALPGVRISVQDDDGLPMAHGDKGEVCVRSGGLMAGYLNHEDLTLQAYRNGWFRTGDIGYLDDDGCLHLVDRAADVIVTGGENVYSPEVESALSSYPDVDQVAVIGVPSDEWGESVHAIVVCRSGARVTEHELLAHARSRLAAFKVPKSIEFRSEPLPLSGAMKVLKRELRSRYWEGRDRSVG
jgi:long-chain acyl-CoA synthetase